MNSPKRTDRSESPKAIIARFLEEVKATGSIGYEDDAEELMIDLQEGGWVIAGLNHKEELDEIWMAGA